VSEHVREEEASTGDLHFLFCCLMVSRIVEDTDIEFSERAEIDLNACEAHLVQPPRHGDMTNVSVIWSKVRDAFHGSQQRLDKSFVWLDLK